MKIVVLTTLGKPLVLNDFAVELRGRRWLMREKFAIRFSR